MAPGSTDTPREKLGDCLRDRLVALLTATEAEAAPILAALSKVEKRLVATKAFYTGYLPGGNPIRVVLAVTGCDKANAAHALTCLLENMKPAPRLVVQAGIAGGFTTGAPTPEIGDVVLATHEAYADTGSSSPEGWLSAADLGVPISCLQGVETGGRFPLDAGLVGAAAAVIRALEWCGADARRTGDATWGTGTTHAPRVLTGPCVTLSQVTGLSTEAEAIAARWGALAESMEGAAAAHVCGLYGIPFLEIRGISNLVVDRDRASWQVEQAIAVAGWAAITVVAALDRLPL